jgi:rod shape-determining protein MreC
MRSQYFRTHKGYKKHSSKKIRPVYVLTALSLFLIIISGFLGVFYNFFGDLFIPVKRESFLISNNISSFFKGFAELRSLSNENYLLNEKNLILEGKLSDLQRIKEENIILKKQLDTNYKPEAYNLVLTQIMYYGPTNTFGFFYIGDGMDKGIKPGDAVILGDYLIGVVSRVFNHYSKVMLVSNINLQLPVYLLGTHTNAIATGSVSSSIVLDDVNQLESIKVGEEILTSGINSNIPKNLVVGYVSNINPNSSILFKNITANPSVNINTLKYLFVILK